MIPAFNTSTYLLLTRAYSYDYVLGYVIIWRNKSMVFSYDIPRCLAWLGHFPVCVALKSISLWLWLCVGAPQDFPIILRYQQLLGAGTGREEILDHYRLANIQTKTQAKHQSFVMVHNRTEWTHLRFPYFDHLFKLSRPAPPVRLSLRNFPLCLLTG